MRIDPLWEDFLNCVYKGGGWRGPRIPWDPDRRAALIPAEPRIWPVNEMDELERLTREIVLSAADAEQTDETSDVTVDLPWREGN